MPACVSSVYSRRGFIHHDVFTLLSAVFMALSRAQLLYAHLAANRGLTNALNLGLGSRTKQ
jgi:hypothetical protein